jgi:hypothetical protein
MTATDNPLHTDAEEPRTAAECLVAVMRAVEAIRKDEKSGIDKETGKSTGGPKFNFRGVDATMNAVGPVLRELGLVILPELVAEHSEMVEYGNQRTRGFRTRVQVRYQFLTAAGDVLAGGVGPIPGESIDSGDKGTAKAMSVAYRTMWLQTLCVPTGDDRDPDQEHYEVAKPVAATDDAETVAKLEARIAAAGNQAGLTASWNAVEAAFGGEKAQITEATRNRLLEACKARAEEIGIRPKGGGNGE